MLPTLFQKGAPKERKPRKRREINPNVLMFFLAVLLTAGYVALLEYGFWLVTRGGEPTSGFVAVNVFVGVLFAWLPAFGAWSYFNKYRRWGHY